MNCYIPECSVVLRRCSEEDISRWSPSTDEPARIISGEVMIEEEAVMPDQEMIADDHQDDKSNPSSFLTSTHQPEVKTEAATHGGPAMIIKEEVMIEEEAILPYQKVIVGDHHDDVGDHQDDVGTPSSVLTSTHQPEVKTEAGTRHVGPAVIIKEEVIIEEEAIMPHQTMITGDHQDDEGTPPSFLTLTHQTKVKDDADTLPVIKDRNSCIPDIIKKELVIKEGPMSAGDNKTHNALQDDLTSTFLCLASQQSHSSAIQYESVSSIRGQSSGKPHVCGICDYRTGCIRSLKVHMRRHTGEKPYSCDICDYRAIQHCSLKRHMMTHTGEKPYSCDTCDYRTGYYSNLRDHMLTHTDLDKSRNGTCANERRDETARMGDRRLYL